MATAELILRFRNFISKIDGLVEHQRIVRSHGSAWWGWWKREDEPDRTADISLLALPFDVTLISPSEEVQAEARVTEVLCKGSPDLALVPAYYRKRASSIPAWFRLDRIERKAFDSLLSAVLARVTHTLLFRTELANTAGFLPMRLSMEAPWLLHISDLHIGTDHVFRMPGSPAASSLAPKTPSKHVTMVEAIAEDVKRLAVPRVGAVIVSGDIVCRNEWKSGEALAVLDELSTRLGVPREAILIVPGNHDFYRHSEKPKSLPVLDYRHERRFREFLVAFYGRGSKDDHLERIVQLACASLPYDICVGLLNSARWTSVPGFFEYGFVGREKFKGILDSMWDGSVKPKLGVLVLHHHIVPVETERPGDKPRRPVSVTLDSAELLEYAQASGVSLILHGHKHVPAVVKTARCRRTDGKYEGLSSEDVFVLAAGSAGSTQLGRYIRNTYTLLSFTADTVTCTIREIDPEDVWKGTFLKVDLPVRVRS